MGIQNPLQSIFRDRSWWFENGIHLRLQWCTVLTLQCQWRWRVWFYPTISEKVATWLLYKPHKLQKNVAQRKWSSTILAQLPWSYWNPPVEKLSDCKTWDSFSSWSWMGDEGKWTNLNQVVHCQASIWRDSETHVLQLFQKVSSLIMFQHSKWITLHWCTKVDCKSYWDVDTDGPRQWVHFTWRWLW